MADPTIPASQVLQQLYSLEPSSPDFMRVLYGLIRHDEDEQYSSSLQGSELTRLVDFLDNSLDNISTSDDVFRQCLRKLRAICGCHTTLPSSHIVSGDLAKTGDHPIAIGGFADVWEGTLGGNRVCVKVLRVTLNDDQSLTKSFFKEAVVWKRLKHPNVVPFLGVTNKPLQFVSEWMPNGTLTSYVKKNPGANRISLLLDVAEGLNYLHTSYTIHGDLKGPNIVVDHRGHACLTDFGLASIAHGINSILATQAHGYTPRWTAPEILQGAERITPEADIFSFGMVVIEAFTGRPPFSDFKHPAVIYKIVDGERPIRPLEAQELGLVDPVWRMTLNCWQQDPGHRPMTARVVEFLRECYTLLAAKTPLSTLAPWQPSRSVDDAANQGSISPNPPRTSQYPGQPNFPTREMPTSPNTTFNIAFPDGFHSGGSSLEPLYGGSRSLSSSAIYTDHSVDKIRNPGIPDQLRHGHDQNVAPRDLRRRSTLDETQLSQAMSEVHRVSSSPSRRDPSPARHTPSGFNYKAGGVISRQQKREKRPEKSGKSLWRTLATALRFMASVKSVPAEDRGR